jgi:hypothetical protein
VSVLAGVVAALATAACGRGGIEVDEGRARAHVDALAGAIGNRPVGSEPAARARQYLIEQLERTGFSVRVQRADAVDERRGLTVPVVNIIAVRNGGDGSAIALVSHYDSDVDAGGALDDALGVAVALEAGRMLAASPLRHSLFVIFTDGEEAGLMGARAVVADPDVRARLRAFLNFDGTGAAGPSLLFETAAGRTGESALAAWASGAVDAEGGSFSTEIYRRLPNDTDFTIFRSLGVPGLNFAPVGDSYAYHTDRDVAARVRIATLRHAIANTVGIVRAIDRDGLAAAAEPSTYFDTGWRGVSYGPAAASAIAATAVLSGAVVWLILLRMLWRERGLAGLLRSVVRGLVIAAVVLGAMVGVGLGIGAARAEVHFWYAAPHWLFLATISGGLLGWMIVAAIAGRFSNRTADARGSHAAWWLALPVWIGMTVGLHLTAPAASYLTSLPLLAAAVVLFFARAHPSRVRIASALVFFVAAHFWLPDTLRLLTFMVPLFGWMGIVPPVWVFAALIAAALIMCGPPAAAVVAGWRPRAAAIVVLVLVVVSVAVVALRAPAYTDDRPERRMLRFVQDDVSKRAWWEQGGPEPRVVANAGDVAGNWSAANGTPETIDGIPPAAGAFRFRAVSRIMVPPPADVRSRLTRLDDGRVSVEITIDPREYLWSTVVLPAGVAPLESSIAGRRQGDVWRATLVTPPGGPAVVRVVVDSSHAGVVGEARVMLQTFSVPGAASGSRVPPWVPAVATTWQPRGLYVIRPFPAALSAGPIPPR